MQMQTRLIPMEELVPLLMLQMEKGGKTTLTVTGGSMLPMLHSKRDSVRLIPVADRQKKGDIILYRRANGQYVLHRIIAVSDGGYICCGDNQAEKEPVAHSQLLAAVDSFTRKGKEYTVSAFGYRCYKTLWVGLFPLRKYYIRLRRFLGNKLRMHIRNRRKRNEL